MGQWGGWGEVAIIGQQEFVPFRLSCFRGGEELRKPGFEPPTSEKLLELLDPQSEYEIALKSIRLKGRLTCTASIYASACVVEQLWL
jgi:hypothetical protein